MDITSLISLINSLNSNNTNAQSNGVMNFFAQNKFDQNTHVEQNSQNQNLNLSQILPLLSMLGGQNSPNIANLFPFLSMINSPNGLSSISNIPGMQNFAPFMQNLNKTKTQQTEEKIIHLKGNDKKISDYKKI